MTALSYDDISLVPRYNNIASRRDADTSVQFGDLKLQIPIMSANMDTVTGSRMAGAMRDLGGLGFLHRFCSIDDNVEMYGDARVEAVVSLGVNEGLDRFHALYEVGARYFCVDIAHGHSKPVGYLIQQIKEFDDGVYVVAGNVCHATGAEYLADKGANAVKVGIGPGCLAAGSRILMSNGFYKNIEDVVAGDRVVNMYGKPVCVKRSFSTGYRDTITIRHTGSINQTRLTPDHQCYVGDLNSISRSTLQSRGYAAALAVKSKTTPKQSKLKWKPVGEMQQDVYLIPTQIEFELPDNWTVDLYDFAVRDKYLERYGNTMISPNYDIGYVFGTFLGDGNAQVSKYQGSTRGSVHWTFGANEIAIAEKLKGSLFECFGVDAVIDQQKDNIIQVHFYSLQFARLLNEFGKRTKKHLPKRYWAQEPEYHKGLWDGLMDSDGHYGNRYQFSNTSPELIELYGVLTYLLYGSFPNVDHREPSAGGLQDCNIENCNPSWVSRLNISHEKRHTNDGFSVMKPLSQTSNQSILTRVYDLEIADDTHSFIADNMVVHNSACTTRIKTGFGVPQFTAIRNCREVNCFIIADGGIRVPGDAVKAFAAGADAVMLGGMLAGTDETPGEVIEVKDPTDIIGAFGASSYTALNGGDYSFMQRSLGKFKIFRGSASKEAADDYLGGQPGWKTAEGVSMKVTAKGPVADVIADVVGGIRSGLTYCGANNLRQIRERTSWVQVTPAGAMEGHAHGQGRL